MTQEAAAQAVSIVLIVKDAMRTLKACLDSARSFDDVVVLDTGSSDGSADLAGSYPNVRLAKGPFENFSDARNRAAALAQNDWICPLDADEILSPALVEALLQLKPQSSSQIYGFWRHNWFLGKRLRSRLGRDWCRRVYHRGAVRFEGGVHERLVSMSGAALSMQSLPGWVDHEPYADVGHVFQKRWFYAQPQLFGRQRGAHPMIGALRGAWRFIRLMLFEGAILDGWRGYILARAAAYGVFLKYVWAYYPHGEKPSEF